MSIQAETQSDEYSREQSSEDWLDEKHPMTLIGSMYCRDHLLLTADSGVGVDGVVLVRPKLNMVPGMPLAWGAVGNDSLGIMFRQWLHLSESHRWTDWGTAQSAVLEKVNELNKWRRAAAAGAGLNPKELKEDDFLEVLLVGYVEDDPQFLSVDERGTANLLLPDHDCVFSGGGRHYAWMVAETLRSHGGWRQDQGQLQEIMTTAIQVGGGGLSLPVRMLKVTPTDATDVSDEAFRKTFPEAIDS